MLERIRFLKPLWAQDRLFVMDKELEGNLDKAIQAFTKLEYNGNAQSVTEAYNRILAIVQAIMLKSDNPDGHDRAWSLLKDDAFKDLAAIQEGKSNVIKDLKVKMSQIGELLLKS